MAAGSPTLISDSEITGVLKTLYAGYREKVFPISTPLMAQIKKGSPGGPKNMKWGGQGVNFDVVLSRPVGLTASASGYLPGNSAVIERQATLAIKRVYVTREIDGLAIFGTQSKEAAYIALAKKILDEAKDAALLGMQEYLHGDGKGVKGLVVSSADTTHCVVTSPYGISGAGQGGLLLDVGMQVAILDTTGVTLRGRAYITAAVNSGDNVTLTLDTAISGMVATDLVVLCTASDTQLNAVPNGLTNILNRGGSYNVLHGLDASTYVRWNGNCYVAGTDFGDPNNPTEQDVWELIARVAAKSGFDARLKPSEYLLVTTPGIEQKIAEQFFGQRRLTPADFVNLKGGWKALTICGLPVISDSWCPAGVIYLVHVPSLTWVTAKDFGQIQYESAGAWRFINGRDAFQINWGEYMNTGTINRLSHGMISGYTDTKRYTFVV